MYEVADQHGRRFVITGANSGTGREAARRLAGAGASVVLAVRSPEKGETVRDEILREQPAAQLEVRQLDLADLSSVRSFAEGLLADGATLDVLVNNAGVMIPPRRNTTVDGFELQFGTNFLGPFALTNLLLPRLLESTAPRVVTMSSSAASIGRIHFGDLQWTRRYRPMPAYAQSKLADLLMSRHLAKVSRDRGWHLLSTAAHPGHTRTNLQTSGRSLGRDRRRRNAGLFRLVPSQGVVTGTEPLLYAATDPAAAQGGYYGPRWSMIGTTVDVRRPFSSRGVDLASSLWSVAQDLTGTALPAE